MNEIVINKDLQLKIPKINDAEEIYQLVDNSRATIAKWLPWANHETLAIQKKFLMENKNVFGIKYKNHFAGLIGFNTINEDKLESEIGYWLGNDFVGHGIMSQSLEAIINYSFNDLGLHNLILKIAIDNDRSNHVAKQAGFTLNQVISDGLKLNDGYHDENIWILKKRSP